MRVNFHYGDAGTPDHVADIGIHTPFGDAIESFCTHMGGRRQEWSFAYWSSSINWPAQIEWSKSKSTTPYEFGLTDEDECECAVVLRMVNN